MRLVKIDTREGRGGKMNKNLAKEWLPMLKQIEDSVSKLLENRLFFREFMGIVEANSELPENNYFIVWIWENYLVKQLQMKDLRMR